jgi:hypothetical protein
MMTDSKLLETNPPQMARIACGLASAGRFNSASDSSHRACLLHQKPLHI